jgi:hypothetical protein
LGREGSPTADVKVGFRTGWFRHIGVAIGGASGAAAVLGGYEVLKAQPNQAFALLQGWGPTFLISILAIFVVGKFLDGLQETVRASFNVVAQGVTSSAMASGRTADALTRLADQGGKQHEEVRRLAIYAAREFPAVYERFDQLDAALKELTEGVKGLHWAVNVKASHGGEGNER